MYICNVIKIKIIKNRAYNNTTAIKALEEVDKELAIKVLSNPNLDGEELSEILVTSMIGNIVNKDTKKPMKLSNKVMMTGLRNKMNQVLNNSNKEF